MQKDRVFDLCTLKPFKLQRLQHICTRMELGKALWSIEQLVSPLRAQSSGGDTSTLMLRHCVSEVHGQEVYRSQRLLDEAV